MLTLPEMLKGHFDDYQIEYRIHATRRMFERDINEDDVEIVLEKGNVIERYDDDFPFPSVLINGTGSDNSYLHVVAAINESERKVFVITTYKPTSLRWKNEFSGRIK
jgi:hypothetical protein